MGQKATMMDDRREKMFQQWLGSIENSPFCMDSIVILQTRDQDTRKSHKSWWDKGKVSGTKVKLRAGGAAVPVSSFLSSKVLLPLAYP